MTTQQRSHAQQDLTRAYERCRSIARREAKNFYFAFLALPPHKRNAMCAMYAFMRRADDIADDESMPVAERRAFLAHWIQSFHHQDYVTDEDDSVFVAVRDTQQRFGISGELLDELVRGTAMDLQEDPPEGVQRLLVRGRMCDVYTTVDALDRYCYFVASVVGLVTVRIFGSRGEHTDEHAIAMGKAFQYTNILRDVREDAERGRIYLPLDLLTAHGATPEDVLSAVEQSRPLSPLHDAMQALAARAELFYQAERPLIAALDKDSRGAMRTLIDIYHALLHRIEHVRLQVFAERVRVSTPHKIALLLRGMLLRSHA